MMLLVNTATDEQLLELVSSDGEAFGVFYDRHHVAVLAALRHRVGSVEVALDLTAEVFAAALERSPSFRDQGVGSARGWLYAIARNKLTDLYRTGGAENRARQQLHMQPLVVSDQELERLEQRLEAEHSGVMEALAELPADERDAVQARVLNEQEYPAIADAFAVSESVVRKRVSRGLQRLRATMETSR